MMSVPTIGKMIKSKPIFTFAMIFLVLLLGIGIGTLVTYHVNAIGPADSQLQISIDGKPVVGGAILAFSQAFEEVSKRVEPAVVNINTEEIVTRKRQSAPSQDPDDPMNELFRRYFDGPSTMPEREIRRSLGSGVIVDPKGYVITNNHVVEGAKRIKVNVPGDEEYTAKLIGTDPVSDIAVIKISGKKDFPYAKIGNAKAMKVGDWVIAIGSPFGLDQTVTAGIISAAGRTFEQGGGPSDYSIYNDYLQTDAAINRGNSGGPLVNMSAEVVGINSFISSTSGSSSGVGFAVPSHLFVKVYNQILQTGKVARGWLGVNFNFPFPFTTAMANFFGVKQGSGVLVTQLSDEKGEPSETGPAAKAGIRPEDVIVEYDGKKITGVQDFRLAVADTPPGRKVKIRVVRHGEEKEFEASIGERQFEDQEKDQYSFEDKEEKPKTEIGLKFDNMPQNLARNLDIAGGAYIASVSPGSLADDAGLIGQDQRASDIIIAANGKKTNTPQDVVDIVKSLKSGDPIVLKFIRAVRDQNNQFIRYTYYTSITKP
jgi:serine protease Do